MWERNLRRGGEEVGFAQTRLDRFHIPTGLFRRADLSFQNICARGLRNSGTLGVWDSGRFSDSVIPLRGLWVTFSYQISPHLAYRHIQESIHTGRWAANAIRRLDRVPGGILCPGVRTRPRHNLHCGPPRLMTLGVGVPGYRKNREISAGGVKGFLS